MKPHRKAAPAEAAAAGRQEMPRCAPKADSGLSSAQAQALAEAGWDNRPVESPTKSDKQIIRENIFTYFNLIFVVLAVCLLLVGDWKDMTFLLIVAANAVIGIVQQLRSKRTIEKLSLLSAAKVRIIRDGKVRELPVDQLVREDVVELTAGCQIPADGPVLTGQVQVNEALITGEADAVTKEPGDQLLSGSFVISGKCRARMDQVGADSYASKLTLAAKKDGGPGKSEMMRSLDSLIRFIGIVLIPIGAALFYNQFVNQDLGLRQSVVSTVAALIGMIPEGLFLLTSVALAVSVVRLAQNRTLIHEMNAIETLARVDVLCVDKTGTVTEGTPAVTEVLPHRCEASDLLSAAAAVEAVSAHPLATAITAYAQEHGYGGTARPESFENLSGRGLKAVLGGETVLAGNRRLLEEHGVDVSSLASDAERLSAQGQTPMYFAKGGTLLGLISVADPVKETSAAAIQKMRGQGIRTVLLTGDNRAAAEHIGSLGGVDEVIAEVLPEEKAGVVERLQSQGRKVMMVGDGINDAPALTAATVGCAIGSGSDIAIESADIVLMRSDLQDVPRAIQLSRLTLRDIKQNLFWAFCYNTIGIPIAAGLLFAFGGPLLSPMFAGAAMSLSSVCVVGNALRLGRAKL